MRVTADDLDKIWTLTSGRLAGDSDLRMEEAFVYAAYEYRQIREKLDSRAILACPGVADRIELTLDGDQLTVMKKV